MENGAAAHASDIIIIGFLVISALVGLICGFTKLLLNIGAWAASIWLSIYGSPYIQPFFEQFIPIPLGAKIASGALIFIITLSLLLYMSSSVASSVKGSPMRGLDRGLGLLLGAGLGALILSILFNFAPMVFSKISYNSLVHDTRLGTFFERGAQLTQQMALTFYNTYSIEQTLAPVEQGAKTLAKEMVKPLTEEAVKAIGAQAQDQLTQLIEQEISQTLEPIPSAEPTAEPETPGAEVAPISAQQ